MLKLRCCCLRASEIQAAGQPVPERSGTDVDEGDAITGEDLPLEESLLLKLFQWDSGGRLVSNMLLTEEVSAGVLTSEDTGGYDDG